MIHVTLWFDGIIGRSINAIVELTPNTIMQQSLRSQWDVISGWIEPNWAPPMFILQINNLHVLFKQTHLNKQNYGRSYLPCRFPCRYFKPPLRLRSSKSRPVANAFVRPDLSSFCWFVKLPALGTSNFVWHKYEEMMNKCNKDITTSSLRARFPKCWYTYLYLLYHNQTATNEIFRICKVQLFRSSDRAELDGHDHQYRILSYKLWMYTVHICSIVVNTFSMFWTWLLIMLFCRSKQHCWVETVDQPKHEILQVPSAVSCKTALARVATLSMMAIDYTYFIWCSPELYNFLMPWLGAYGSAHIFVFTDIL